MKIAQLHYQGLEFHEVGNGEISDPSLATLVLGFGDKNQILNPSVYNRLSEKFPNAEIVLCSSAGEILGNSIQNEIIVCTAIQFEKTMIKTSSVELKDSSESFEMGKRLVEGFDGEDLVHILVLSDGLIVNGSQLVKGMQAGNSKNVPITGGLAGDSINFEYTAVGLNEVPEKGKVVALAFYGKNLDVRYSCIS